MIIDSLLSAEVLAVLLAVLLGCFVKGALGFGLPLIATPIMLFVLPLPEIVAILALPITIVNIQQIWLNRKRWQILKQFWPLVTTSTLIMLVGAPLMMTIDSRLLGILIGLMIALHAILSSFPLRQFQDRSLEPKTMNRLIIPAGVASGILGSLTTIYSFPSLQLFMMMRIKKDDLAMLLGVFLSLGFVALWLGISHAGFPVGDNLLLSAVMLIPAVAGQQAGHLARRRISETTFRHIVHFALACAGFTLMIRGITSLI
jgi:hypothetical protein